MYCKSSNGSLPLIQFYLYGSWKSRQMLSLGIFKTLLFGVLGHLVGPLLPQENICSKIHSFRNIINPNQTKGGYKVPKAFSNAYHFVYDEIWIINPSCKFLFWS